MPLVEVVPIGNDTATMVLSNPAYVVTNRWQISSTVAADAT